MITHENILIKVENDDLVRGRFDFPKHITKIGPGAFKDLSLTHLLKNKFKNCYYNRYNYNCKTPSPNQ